MIQSVVVRFAGGEATLNRGKEPNLPIVTPEGQTVAEVSWPLGLRHVLVRNTSLDRPMRSVTGALTVEAIHGNGAREVIHENPALTLEWLTGEPVALAPPTVDIPEVCADFVAYYASGGPPHYDVPTDVLMDVTSVRPWPDGNVTSSNGSGRLAACRVPAALAAILLHERGEQPSPKLLEAWERDVVRQWKRGCHPDKPATDDPLLDAALGYRPWYALENHEWICSGGYSKSETKRGGFNKLYSHVLPPGVDFEGSGDLDCDMAHFAVDQQILAGVLTRNVPALLDAFGAIQSAMSLLPHEQDPLGRGHGHLLRACALWYHACHKLFPSLAVVMAANIGEILSTIEARVFNGKDSAPGAQRRALRLDNGTSTDAYHLTAEAVAPVLQLLGADTPANRKAAAKSLSSWGHGIMAIGLDETIAAPLPEDLHARAEVLLAIDAHAMLVHASGPAFEVGKDGSMRGYRSPPAPGWWDDVSLWEAPGLPDLPAPVAQGGIGESGIYARFVDAPLRVLKRRLGTPRARELADRGLSWCNERGNWNGDYWRWLLECGWYAGGDHGRGDVRDVR